DLVTEHLETSHASCTQKRKSGASRSSISFEESGGLSLEITSAANMSPGDTSPRRRPAPIDVSGGGIGQQPAGRWRQLSPTTADRLLAENGGIPGDTGIFGETAYTPGGSPRFSSKGKKDSRRKLLLNLTYVNLFLALVLIIVGSAGPQYPGHSGTTNNPVSTWADRRLTTHVSPLYQADCPTEEVDGANASILRSALTVGLVILFTQPFSARHIAKQVDRGGATATLLTSVVSALTCLGSFAVVMVDINYIAGCCSLLEDNCEVSNLCTQFVDDCCISDAVQDYCGNPSYHVGAVSMMFLVFVTTSSMVIMASTITCRCWVDSDPEKQAMLMVLTGSPYGSPRGQPESPKFSPRNTVLSAQRFGDTSGGRPANGGTPTRKSSHNQSVRTRGEGRHGSGPGSGGWEAGEEKPAAGPATRERCPQCGAVFGDVSTLLNHVERFHPKATTVTGIPAPSRASVSPSSTMLESNSAGIGRDSARVRPSLARKGSTYEPEEGPVLTIYPSSVSVAPARPSLP
ncbi:unnamed protein product, partial [Ectocarpus sp. 4 AP-2014]